MWKILPAGFPQRGQVFLTDKYLFKNQINICFRENLRKAGDNFSAAVFSTAENALPARLSAGAAFV
jgi:hypothetical protein